MQLDLLRPSVRSLNNSRHQINGASLVASRIRSTESDRVGTASINLQRQPRMFPITDEANTREGDPPEEEEWIRIPHARWREVVHERREGLEGTASRRWLEINGEHRLSLRALAFKCSCKIGNESLPFATRCRAATCAIMPAVPNQSGGGSLQCLRNRESARGTDRASKD